MKAKSYYTKALLILVSLLSILLLSGCGAKVSSNLTIDSDGKGKSEIIAKVTNSDFSKIKGGEAALDDVLNKNKPDVVQLTKTKTAEGISYIFSFEFNNIEEYAQKIRKITGKDVTPTLEISGSIFSKKYAFKDSTKLYDSIKWALKAVTDAKLTTYSESDLYDDNGINVTINANKANIDYSSNSYVCNNNYPIENIDITTEIKGEKKIKRNISFSLKNENANMIGTDKIETYFKNNSPQNITIISKIENDMYTCLINIPASTANEVKKATEQIFQDKKTSLVFIDKEKTSLFKPEQVLSEKINLSDFILSTTVNKIKYSVTLGGSYKFKNNSDNKKNDDYSKALSDYSKVSNELMHYLGSVSNYQIVNEKQLIMELGSNERQISLDTATYRISIWIYIVATLILLLLIAVALLVKRLLPQIKQKLSSSTEARVVMQQAEETNQALSQAAAAKTGASTLSLVKDIARIFIKKAKSLVKIKLGAIVEKPSTGSMPVRKQTALKLIGVIALIAFVFPFLTVSCSKQELMTVSGLQLATGFAISGQKIPPNVLVILALILAIASFVFSFLIIRKAKIANIATNAVGAILLLVLKWNITQEAAKQSVAFIDVDVRFGYYLALLSFISAAVYGIYVLRNQQSAIQPSASDQLPDCPPPDNVS